MELDGVLLGAEGPEVEVTEWEEDRVSEWEVLTRHHSVSPPSTPLPQAPETLRSALYVGTENATSSLR
jgi:hypothetical protein